jgi:outer membrane protein TolC
VEVSAAPIESQVDLVTGEEGAERATVRAAAAAASAAEKAMTLHEQAWLPTLAAEGNLRYSNVSGFGGDNFVATAALNLVIPLYDSGARYAAHDAAVAVAVRAQAERRRIELDADAAKLEADAKVESTQAELALAEARLRTAGQAVAQVESLAAAGLATDLELADADRVRFAADSALAQQRFALDVAKIQRVYARGGRLAPKGATTK